MNNDKINISKNLRNELESIIKNLVKFGEENVSKQIIKKINEFIKKIFPEETKKHPKMTQISLIVQNFIYEISMEYMMHIQQNNKNIFFEDCLKQFENLIIRCLSKQLIELIGEDNKYKQLINAFSFLNLDDFNLKTISPKNKIFLYDSISSFVDIRDKLTAYDKLVHIKNLCKKLVGLYGLKNLETILIFCIISSQIYNLKSHIRFCSLFRSRNLISNEEDFFLEKFFCAFEKIENYKQHFDKILIMDKSVFYNKMNNYHKNKILKEIKFENGKFENNFFIDEKLIRLINSKYEEKKENLKKNKNTDSNNMLLSQNINNINNIQELISIYCNKQRSNMTLKDFTTIKNILFNIITYLKNK